jgi:hypothetical protein
MIVEFAQITLHVVTQLVDPALQFLEICSGLWIGHAGAAYSSARSLGRGAAMRSVDLEPLDPVDIDASYPRSGFVYRRRDGSQIGPEARYLIGAP